MSPDAFGPDHKFGIETGLLDKNNARVVCGNWYYSGSDFSDERRNKGSTKSD
jgi:hypothetical protein